MEQTPDNTWKTWIDVLAEDKPIWLDARNKEQAELALKELLLRHFEALVNMLKLPG